MFSSGKRTSFQIVRKFPVSANLSIQSTGHISSICSCSGILLILCEQEDQHYFTLFWIKLNMYDFCSDFICYWVQEFIKDNWPWCWHQTALILLLPLLILLCWTELLSKICSDWSLNWRLYKSKLNKNIIADIWKGSAFVLSTLLSSESDY